MKHKFNIKSIRFRIWGYLLLFTVVTLGLLWLLQIFFINNYYEEMKKDDTNGIAVQISSKYKSDGLKSAISEAKSATQGNDLFVCITQNGERQYPSVEDSSYALELSDIETNFKSRDPSKDAVTGTVENPSTKRSVYYYAELMRKDESQTVKTKEETEEQGSTEGDEPLVTNEEETEGETVLYVLAPMYPVSSTIDILQRQLLYVMLISLILAFLISIVLTNRISKPIVDITGNAQKLANGQYGINFPVQTGYQEITDLATTLNKMSNELERSAMMQQDLMANVSHDLRTPLTMIKSYAEMIRDLSGDNPEKRTAHLNVIIEESDRLNSLVNDMLALSSLQAGTMVMDIKPFNIYEAVDTILAPYKVLEEKEGYNVIFNCKKDIWVEGDEERIKQVISNLLSNGVKYCGEDKTVIINIRRWGNKVHFEVTDHGVGIKPEELSHIWERYYKTSSNHVRPTRGSGLGLSIVKEILQLHGAKFGVESKVGKGTTVWFELKTSKKTESVTQ